MEGWQAVSLALIQGLTEFLPISSSAHLVLYSRLLGLSDQGLDFDVAVHCGSLLAVLSYFRRELLQMGRAWLASWGGADSKNADNILAWQLLVATLPIVLVGGLGRDWVASGLRNVLAIALANICFALLLWLAYHRRNPRPATDRTLPWRVVLVIGLSQVLALVPGASRSGVTITAGLLMGLSLGQAARFSFLLAIPVILAAGSLSAWRIDGWGSQSPFWLLVATAVAALSAYISIAWFLKWVDRIGLMPFVVYRLGLALFLLVWLAAKA